MREQSRGPFEFRAARLGRTELGTGSVVVDDDAFTIVVPATEERSIRLRLSIVHALVVENALLTVELRDGTMLTIEGDQVADLRIAVLEASRTLPELTRALRALGSRRGHGSNRESGPDEQQRFFAPLLMARRAATAAMNPAAAIAAFDPASLDRQFHAALHLFATERFGSEAPARRALEAELVDLVEPLGESLTALGVAAAEASADVDDLRRWRAWSAKLLAMFEMADRVWLALDDALDTKRTWRSADDARGKLRARTPPTPPFRKRR